MDLAGLLGKKVTGWLRTAGSRIFRAIRPFRAVMRFIRREVGEVPVAEVRRIAEYVREQEQFRLLARTLGDEDYIPLSWISDKHGLRLQRQFMYRVQVLGIDPETGEKVERWMTIYSDTPQTVGTLREEAFSLAERFSDEYEIVPEEVGDIEALMRPEE